MQYKITPINGEESDYLDDKLVEYNLAKMPAACESNRVVYWFGKKITDHDGKIIAGCVAARTIWGTAEVSILWVDEAFRHQSLGSELLRDVEREAKAHACTIIQLDTFDWQAKKFYEKNGYTVFGVLSNCPKGHSRYYMSKSL